MTEQEKIFMKIAKEMKTYCESRNGCDDCILDEIGICGQTDEAYRPFCLSLNKTIINNFYKFENKKIQPYELILHDKKSKISADTAVFFSSSSNSY